jgi:hypothetical protein
MPSKRLSIRSRRTSTPSRWSVALWRSSLITRISWPCHPTVVARAVTAIFVSSNCVRIAVVCASKRASIGRFSTALQKTQKSTEMEEVLYTSSRTIGCPIVVGNECEKMNPQLLNREATQPSKQATYQNAEPDLNLIEPGTLLWGVGKTKTIAGGRRETLHALPLR